MASLKKRGKRYSIRFVRSVDGEREEVTLSLGTSWKEVAVKKKKQLEILYDKHEIDPFDPEFNVKGAIAPEPIVMAPKTMRKAYDQFMLTKQRMRQATITAYKNNITHFLDFINGWDLGPKSISKLHLQKFLFRDGISNVSAATNARVLKTFFKYMREEGWININPVKGIKLEKGEVNYFDKMLTDKELVKLFEAFDSFTAEKRKQPNYREHMEQEWFKPLIALYYYTGLRLSEAAYNPEIDYSGIKGKNFINDYKVIHLPPTKGKKERFVPISKYLRPYLTDFMQLRGEPDPEDYFFVNLNGPFKNKPISAATVRDVFNSYCKKAGIPKSRTIHGLRHNKITNWIEQGFSLSEAAELAGHSSTRITEGVYTHLAFNNLEAKFRRLEEED
jgi:site-specific recombinase XerD